MPLGFNEILNGQCILRFFEEFFEPETIHMVNCVPRFGFPEGQKLEVAKKAFVRVLREEWHELILALQAGQIPN